MVTAATQNARDEGRSWKGPGGSTAGLWAAAQAEPPPAHGDKVTSAPCTLSPAVRGSRLSSTWARLRHPQRDVEVPAGAFQGFWGENGRGMWHHHQKKHPSASAQTRWCLITLPDASK